MSWVAVAKIDDIGVDEVLPVNVAGKSYAIYKLNNTYYATDNVCTHSFALLSDGWVEDDCIECPLHQARFHIPTGEVRSPPADKPLCTYGVKVEGDQLIIDVPQE